ncbi:MAG: SRPBCC family protein [Gammaproteobacteria bacterium]|nr:SRPBCC family protein [Gammaproteobacteria bacterium]MBV9620623.1 SRPBCC family protein [Gammaproteobacteria bacterium]
MPSQSVHLHRVLRAPPERIYRAFLEPAALAKWLPPNGYTCRVHHLEARVGGTHQMTFTDFGSGEGHTFGGTYLELAPHERIRYTDRFEEASLAGEMQTTITLLKLSCGTELSIVQEGVPSALAPEMCYLGWQESLVLLGKLVEPELRG